MSIEQIWHDVSRPLTRTFLILTLSLLLITLLLLVPEAPVDTPDTTPGLRSMTRRDSEEKKQTIYLYQYHV